MEPRRHLEHVELAGSGGQRGVAGEPGERIEIQRGLQRVLLDPALRAQMKQRGYEQAQRFSWTTSVSRILEIYAK